MADPDIDEYKSRRLNTLAVAAFIMVLSCLGIAVWMSGINEYAKGIVTFLLGRFSGYVDLVYNFEFGTTRGSKDKDDTITNLSGATPVGAASTAANTAALTANTSATTAATAATTEGKP